MSVLHINLIIFLLLGERVLSYFYQKQSDNQ